MHIKWILDWRSKKDYIKAAKSLKIQMLFGLLSIFLDWIMT